MMAGITLVPLNPLSVPRGVRYVDELTGEPAKFIATVNGSAYYYATQASFTLDYDGILGRIAPLLADVTSLTASVGSSSERAAQIRRMKQLQHQIASLCEAAASHHLLLKNFELAIPPALRSLRTMLALYGEGAAELVPAYLVLAEVNLGLSRTAQADEFLSTANYIMVKNVAASSKLRSRLHRNFGRLHAAQGNNAAALDAFARDVYFGAMACGPESIECSIGYFFMAQVFAAQARMDTSLVFFDKVVECWYKHMLGERSAISLALGIDFRVRAPESLLGDARGAALVARSAAAAAAAAAAAVAAAAVTALGAPSADIAGAAPSPSATAKLSVTLAADAAAAAAAATESAAPVTMPPLTDTQVTEGLEMLDFIARVRTTQLGERHLSTAEVKYTHALVLLQAKRVEEARALLIDALAIFSEQLPEEHPTIVNVRTLLEADSFASLAASGGSNAIMS